MSKVHVAHTLAKDTFKVSAAVVATGWLPGMGFTLTAQGELADIANVDNLMFVGIDDDDELSAPPTGSLLTGIYGTGTKFTIDHSEEVAAGSATRAYASNVESATVAANLYIGTDGKWTAVATGSVKGKMFQIPTADNNYSLGIITRF
jgi:hypothetical protein